MIRPGPLSASDAAEINAALDKLRALDQLFAPPPLSVRRGPGGIPIITMDRSEQVASDDAITEIEDLLAHKTEISVATGKICVVPAFEGDGLPLDATTAIATWVQNIINSGWDETSKFPIHLKIETKQVTVFTDSVATCILDSDDCCPASIDTGTTDVSCGECTATLPNTIYVNFTNRTGICASLPATPIAATWVPGYAGVTGAWVTALQSIPAPFNGTTIEFYVYLDCNADGGPKMFTGFLNGLSSLMGGCLISQSAAATPSAPWVTGNVGAYEGVSVKPYACPDPPFAGTGHSYLELVESYVFDCDGNPGTADMYLTGYKP